MTTTTLDELVELLDLEQIELDIFRGRNTPGDFHRVFGGQVAAQALAAAGRTVSVERRVHSLHAYFLRAGDPDVPIVYQVDRSRDGRSFSARRVVAIQHGRQIFNLSASFQVPAAGFEHQDAMPAAPDPDALPTIAQRLHRDGVELTGWYHRPRPIDIRYVDDPPILADGATGRSEPAQLVWIRADGTLPEDPLLHACVITYASDMSLLDSVLLGHGLRWASGRAKVASLDHAMWFHRPARADDWLLYAQRSPAAAGARGFCRGELFSRDGTLVVSVAQEGMFRTTD